MSEVKYNFLSVLLIIFLVVTFTGCTTRIIVPKVDWNYTFGDSGRDESYSVKQTLDKGYIIAGFKSNGINSYDALLVKTYTNGTEQWERMFGGGSTDVAYSVQQTKDKGYIFAGWTESNSLGPQDAWLVKTNSSGDEQWERKFGGDGFDYFYSVQQTSDKGFIMAGNTNSFGDSYDAWLIKTDFNGSVQWNKTFGGSNYESAYSVQQTSDGGFILAGNTNSFGAGNADFWIIKTDRNGNKQWDKTFGGVAADYAYSIQQTIDGGFVVVGNTFSFGKNVLLVKTDRKGNEKWRKIYGGASIHGAYEVQQTKDNGYIIAGFNGVDRGGAWVLKTDKNGNEQWNMILDDVGTDSAKSIQQTRDGDYVVAGFTYVQSQNNLDFWLIKLSSEK